MGGEEGLVLLTPFRIAMVSDGDRPMMGHVKVRLKRLCIKFYKRVGLLIFTIRV